MTHQLRLVPSSVSPVKEREDPIFIPANTEAGAFIDAIDREVAYYDSSQGGNAPSAECPLNESTELILELISCAFDSHMRPQRSEVSATITPAPPFHPVLRFYGIFPDPVPFPGAAHTISGADMDDPQAVFFSKGK
ncbi:hypothetical protein H9L39_18002 [Fusarium oxysporum f. sp. albedinis]|nr:hypothetical protein H9L39_18002 [Fusarium oxysporum f. sp. albedinis]